MRRAARIARAGASLTALFLLAGCASIAHGPSQTIRVRTIPSGARVTLLPTGEVKSSPAAFTVSRKLGYTVRVEQEGYRTQYGYFDRVASGWVLLDSPAGVAMDTDSGGAYRLVPEELEIRLEKRPEAVPAP